MKAFILSIAIFYLSVIEGQIYLQAPTELFLSPVAGSPASPPSGGFLLEFQNIPASNLLIGPLTGIAAPPEFRELELTDAPFAVNTTTNQTVSGIKTFDNNLLVYNASNARKFGINSNSPAYIFDMKPAATDEDNPIFMVRNANGDNGFLLDLDANNMRMGLFDEAGDTQVNFRSNGVSFVSLKFEVGENLQDIDDENPQFKVLGLQDYTTDRSDMTYYQQTIQHHTNTTGQSAAIGFGVDAGAVEAFDDVNSDVFEIDNQKIGAYIAHTRTGASSLGTLSFGVKKDAGTAPETLLTLSGEQVNFPKVTAANSIAVFDASKNLIAGTVNTSTSGLQLASNALSLNINNLTSASTVDKSNDYVAIYDVSTSSTVKAKITDVAAGYTLQGSTNSMATPAGGTSYYFGAIADITGSTANINRVLIPKAGTIKAIYVYFYNAGTSSNENGTLAVKINNGSDNVISTTVKNNNTSTLAANTSMALAVDQGDYLEIKWTSASWATAPTNVRASFVVYIE